MLKQPKFKHCFQWLYIEALKSNVFLLTERNSVLLNDRIHELLMPLIDGRRTVDQIVDLLRGEVSATDVYYTLMWMEQKGYLVESDVESQDILPSSFTIFCEYSKVDPYFAYKQLQATNVSIKPFGSNLPASEFKTILESLYLQVVEQGDIEVILTDDYLKDGLETFNEKALTLSRPWMLVKPLGTIVWIGPIFVPGKTGCWHCLAQRLRNNRPVEQFIAKHQDTTTSLPAPLGSLPTTCQTALSMAATELFKWIVQGKNSHMESRIITYDTLSLETQFHILVKRPQCPSCGVISHGLNREPRPVVLGHCQKTFTAGGGHRCISPEETLWKYQHHISPLTGVVRGLRKSHQDPQGLIHTYVASHHFATIFDDLNALRQNISGRSAGKGRTDSQAQTSGFCEAIERYSHVFQGDEIRQTGSYRQMADQAIHPNICMKFSQIQYEHRHQWNQECSGWFQRVPEPFDEDREIEWTPVWSLTHHQFKYLPTAYCYFNYPNLPNPDCWADLNGSAAGNTLEEAILQGFMELVERDCVALWWYNRLKKPQVNLESFADPYFQSLKNYYQTLHRELWVLDITSDLNIPAFVAISRRIDREVEDIILGFGAHFDPTIAISRALTEMNQGLPYVLFAKVDGSTQYPSSSDSLPIQWWKMATLENQSYLVPDQNITAKVCTDYPQFQRDDLLEDVMTCQQIVEMNGMEMLVLDQTRPDIGLPVVKVIVPGMRHWWKRLGLGRLYEVPVKIGWSKEPLQEHQLNPFPMWM
jgi:oxazoline/thiazoline synthase